MNYCSRGCGRPMVSSAGTCGDAYCAASPVTLDFPPASSPAHDPVTCICCQIALGAAKERDKREAGHGEAFGIVLDQLTDAKRGVVKARAEREDTRRFARRLVEKVRRIQGHIEAGGANDELTAATVLCSEILAEDEWGMV